MVNTPHDKDFPDEEFGPTEDTWDQDASFADHPGARKGGKRHHGHGPRGFGPGGAGFPGHGFGEGPGFDRGRFGGRRGSRAARGDIRGTILSLLNEQANNGYQIIKTIADATAGSWRPSPGSIYPTLQQLVDEGLIEPLGEGKRTSFTLTEEGRAYFEEHQETLQAAWNDIAESSAAQAGFRDSVAKLHGVIKQVHRVASEEQQQNAQKIIDEARRKLYLLLAE